MKAAARSADPAAEGMGRQRIAHRIARGTAQELRACDRAHLLVVLGRHLLPAAALARQLLEQRLRRAEHRLRLRQRHLQCLRLGRPLLEVGLELGHLRVEPRELALALGEPLLRRVELGLERGVLLHHRPHLLEDDRVLEVRLHPRRQGRGGDRDAVDRVVLERVRLLREELGDRVVDLGGDVARVEVDDFIFDRAVACTVGSGG